MSILAALTRTSQLEASYHRRDAAMHSPIQPASLTEADVLTALRDCYDPEIPLNIVDLGLVHAVAIAPDPDAPGAGIPGVPFRQRVSISLVLAQIVSPEDTPLIAQIQNRLAAFETISRTEVTLLSEPAWNPGRISPEGRARLANPLSSKQSVPNKPDALVQIQIKPDKTNA
jgi:metal-sulfur cluster biosynthetic enzyme